MNSFEICDWCIHTGQVPEGSGVWKSGALTSDHVLLEPDSSVSWVCQEILTHQRESGVERNILSLSAGRNCNYWQRVWLQGEGSIPEEGCRMLWKERILLYLTILLLIKISLLPTNSHENTFYQAGHLILRTSMKSSVCVYVCVWLVTQACPALCNPRDCSLPGSVHRILQARILEWVAMPFSRGSSPPRQGLNQGLLHWQTDSLPSEPPGKPQLLSNPI